MEQDHFYMERSNFWLERTDLKRSHQELEATVVTGYLFKRVSNSFLYLISPAGILVSIRGNCIILFSFNFSV